MFNDFFLIHSLHFCSIYAFYVCMYVCLCVCVCVCCVCMYTCYTALTSNLMALCVWWTNQVSTDTVMEMCRSYIPGVHFHDPPSLGGEAPVHYHRPPDSHGRLYHIQHIHNMCPRYCFCIKLFNTLIIVNFIPSWC